MRGKCREFELAQKTGGLETPEFLEHLPSCASCAFESNELAKLGSLLRDLGHAESWPYVGSPELWAGLQARLAAPRLRHQLPLPLAGVSRLAGTLARPAVAAAWATGIVGVLLGLWLGRATAVTEETRIDAETGLIEGPQGSVTELFAGSFADDNASGDSTQSP